MKKFYFWTLIAAILVLIGLLVTLGKARAEAPSPSPKEMYDTAMEQWLDRLQFDESRTNPLLVILDSNNKYSYGCLQFQMETWEYYSRKYGIMTEIMDCQSQRDLAKLMVTDDYGAWRNWFNSVTKKTSGYPPKKP